MTDDALEQFLAEDPGGPVVMLNLLRYVPGTGRADYLAYIAHTPTISGRYGTEPLSGVTAGPRWSPTTATHGAWPPRADARGASDLLAPTHRMIVAGR